jgi:hypothetical protein
MLFSRALTAGMRTHCPDALGGHVAYTPDEIGGEVVQVTVSEEPDPVEQAQQVCDAAGLTADGLIAFCLLASKGKIATLVDLPRQTLDRIIQQGISGETVAKCNGSEPDPEPEPDPIDDELPAAWSA